jgi:hypothetical protein
MAQRRRRTTTTAVIATAVIALILPVTAGCDAKKTLDCAKLALAVAGDVDDLQRAVVGAALNRNDADKILDDLNKDVDKVQDHADNVDVRKAADDLKKAAGNVRTAVDKGEHPDLSPVKNAAGQLTNVCTSG